LGQLHRPAPRPRHALPRHAGPGPGPLLRRRLPPAGRALHRLVVPDSLDATHTNRPTRGRGRSERACGTSARTGQRVGRQVGKHAYSPWHHVLKRILGPSDPYSRSTTRLMVMTISAMNRMVLWVIG